MAILSLNNVSFTYSHPSLLDSVTLHIDRGQRIGLVGRNGAGKSTLLKILNGELQPDDGSIEVDAEIVIAQLAQEVAATEGQTAFQVAAQAFGENGGAVHEYRKFNHVMQQGTDLPDQDAKTYEQASEQLAHAELWDAGDRLEGLLTEMQLPPDAAFNDLSAGMKRRVLLAQAMIQQPDILLLDEPTNHLDIDSIIWLQGYLKRFAGTLVFVTHDRVFLQDNADRIVEVDRGRLFDWTCDYATFLKRRDDMLAAEEVAEAHFDRKLAEEEKWIRQGIKARRTRNEGRVRALKKMRTERQERRQKLGTAKLRIQEVEKSGRLVARLQNVSHSFGGPTLIDKFSTTVFRGDRIGLIGPNGSGKSTLLKILLGELPPESGQVRIGTNISIGYFDQLRGQLDPTKTARENVSEGTDELLINGHKRHVMGYLQDFLFAPDRAHTRVGFLSGGERNRLLLAKLLSKPTNVLVLDEPTNDLDAETLELLEETLPDFPGTILLVSHDRAFLNNVVTSTIVFEGDGVVNEYDGGYDDWLRQKKARDATAAARHVASATPSITASVGTATVNQSGKLSFKEKRELDALPDIIDKLERRQAELQAQLVDPALYKTGGEAIAALQADLEATTAELDMSFQRWEQLA
ncbi:MAG: ATP-binding cassette domain-containing protein [Fuerstiella sp.]|nr:ATP-binding cassette domain-containing protein [Fuerstiella sp.]MCP4856233.1 ATP-binding cassette domain-containing protein [Fuerstiella sp.]